MMTVEELMEQLQKYPPYYRVAHQQGKQTRYVEWVNDSSDSGERIVVLELGRGA